MSPLGRLLLGLSGSSATDVYCATSNDQDITTPRFVAMGRQDQSATKPFDDLVGAG
jgi:hypothetical protein